MATPTEPSIRIWQRHLMDEMAKVGRKIEARRSRITGSTMWRVDGSSRWISTSQATRAMEVAIYGKPNP